MEVRGWDSGRVGSWLAAAGLPQLADRFRSADIDGPMLMALDGASAPVVLPPPPKRFD